MLVGGSKKLESDEHFDQMKGSTIVQKFNVAQETWSIETDLPAPVFEVHRRYLGKSDYHHFVKRLVLYPQAGAL